VDVGTLAQRLTVAVGIDSFLVRALPPDMLYPARGVMLIGTALWGLVVVAFFAAWHFRSVFRRIPRGAAVERITRAGRDLSRVGRITQWLGHGMVGLGAVFTAGLWWTGAPYPLRAVVFSAILHLSVMLPCSLITRLYGRAIEGGATSS
jgi:hypothetical protein